ncbi:MAG TPA: DUF1569 domain-containing protein, partial [Phycisphaerales bacterium]|nr:DUF1569 domain-containing protein [Phycisphaerales bacterium]
MAPIDTAKVTDRRKLRFKSPEDALRDAEALVAADFAGTLRSTGNWTLGQTLGHLASWINYSFDGFPIRKPPFFIRWILKGRKSQFVQGEMRQGVKIPGV